MSFSGRWEAIAGAMKRAESATATANDMVLNMSLIL
jgi:hypothetical protein